VQRQQALAKLEAADTRGVELEAQAAQYCEVIRALDGKLAARDTDARDAEARLAAAQEDRRALLTAHHADSDDRAARLRDCQAEVRRHACAAPHGAVPLLCTRACAGARSALS
jgi:hypothetical protein